MYLYLNCYLWIFKTGTVITFLYVQIVNGIRHLWVSASFPNRPSDIHQTAIFGNR